MWVTSASKPVACPDIPCELGGRRDRSLGDGPAAQADQVDVGGVVGQVVGRRAVVQMGVRDDRRAPRGRRGRGRSSTAAAAAPPSLGDLWRRPRPAFRARGTVSASTIRRRCGVSRIPRARSAAPRSLTSSPRRPVTRFSCAETWLCSSWPTAAMSITQISLDSTSPYSRAPALYSLAAGLRTTPSVSSSIAWPAPSSRVHLDDPGGVGQQQLDLAAVLTGPPEAQLGRQRPDLLAGLLVEQPGVAVPLQERAAVVASTRPPGRSSPTRSSGSRRRRRPPSARSARPGDAAARAGPDRARTPHES